MQGQRDPGLIEMGVEAGRSLESANVELIRKLKGNFGLVSDGSDHGGDHSCGSDCLSYVASPTPLMI
jgi:hypothetical protein